jgi:hypothetical protein
MSDQSVVDTRDGIRTDRTAGFDRSRAVIVAVALWLGTAGSVALTWWHPDPASGDAFTYQQLAPIREAWWAFHMFGGLGTAVSVIAAALAVCMLARTRGAVWATAAAAVATTGALLFGAGAAGEATIFPYATDPAALPPGSGTTLVGYVNTHPDLYVTVLLPGLVLMGIGSVLMSVALWRAHAVPYWIPIVFVAGTVIGFLGPSFGILGVLCGLPSTVALVAIGWYVWRRFSTSSAHLTKGNSK